MTLSVTILGSSAWFATLERASSGYLVEFGDTRLWVDAGGGTWRNLIGHIDYADLSGIILSHRHPDHTTDVFQAFHAREFGQAEAMPSIPLWAPQETVDMVREYASSVEDAFDLNPVDEGSIIEVDGAKLSFVRMVHPPETLGIRIEHGDSVFAYSSDTGPLADFGALAGGAGLFLCEATFQDGDELWEGHMSATQAGQIADEANVGRLVLTHLPPRRDHNASLSEARATGDNVPVELAFDGAKFGDF